ncbi:MAG: hypothetical protein Q4G49_03700 [Paracoccus sp. (in: a-proteobacteria)]|nr:hypothetical protein [Paracoccus sp. (in: a-proteobacteria)]
MSQPVIKLESFSPAANMARVAASAARAALDDAYARGMADGRAARQESETVALTAALRELSQQITGDEVRRTALRHEAVAALSPILTAMLDAVAPLGTAQRLEQDLVTELSRLAQQVSPMICHITCAPALRALVERCASEAGLTGIEITEQPLGRSVKLNITGGHIEFSHDQVVQSVRRLIAEIQED